MKFNRLCLSYSIAKARKEQLTEIYDELFSILYRLLEQEKICHNFITVFYYYEHVSKQAFDYYLDCVQNSSFQLAEINSSAVSEIFS